MKDERRDFWAHYIRDLASRMELRDWTVTLMYRPSDAGTDAQVEMVFGRKSACIRLADDFDDKDEKTQRHTIVHELLHCHMHLMRSCLYQAQAEFQKQWIDLLVRQHDIGHEYATDAIADIIAPFMPLPSEPS